MKTIILNTRNIVVPLREQTNSIMVDNYEDEEKVLMSIIVDSLAKQDSALIELEYSCYYIIEEECSGLLYQDTDYRKSRIYEFGKQLFENLQKLRLYTRDGFLPYQYHSMIGPSLMIDRLDLERNEIPGIFAFTKETIREKENASRKIILPVSRYPRSIPSRIALEIDPQQIQGGSQVK